MLDGMTFWHKGNEKSNRRKFRHCGVSRFVLVDVHGEPLPQPARMRAALLARDVAATLVTERNANHLVVERRAHRAGATRQDR
jgi:hypothetical protein